MAWALPSSLLPLPDGFAFTLMQNSLADDITISLKGVRRSNQSILKKISPEYSLEGLTDAEAEALILWPPDMKN